MHLGEVQPQLSLHGSDQSNVGALSDNSLNEAQVRGVIFDIENRTASRRRIPLADFESRRVVFQPSCRIIQHPQLDKELASEAQRAFDADGSAHRLYQTLGQ